MAKELLNACKCTPDLGKLKVAPLEQKVQISECLQEGKIICEREVSSITQDPESIYRISILCNARARQGKTHAS
jgi:hypothetical protein